MEQNENMETESWIPQIDTEGIVDTILDFGMDEE